MEAEAIKAFAAQFDPRPFHISQEAAKDCEPAPKRDLSQNLANILERHHKSRRSRGPDWRRLGLCPE